MPARAGRRYMATGVVKQTKLWEIISRKLKSQDVLEIEKACNNAEDLLGRIPDTFPTYTLHDATHSMNVCNLMYELLGDQADKLTGLEAAFLILSAFYHDIGMVYTPEEKSRLLNSQNFSDFQKKRRYIGDNIKANSKQVSDDIEELYFRTIHFQRMDAIPADLTIENESIKQKLIVLCKSHGGSAREILNCRELTSGCESTDLVFCAILLRLADILDFDQSRAPDVLYKYLNLKDVNTQKNEKSKGDFSKHRESLCFKFPEERRNGYKIHFCAQCYSIENEHEIRSFLEVIKLELKECTELLSIYKTRLNNMILPTDIDIDDSYGKNYQYGQYLFTVEQDKAFKLFVGKNLYTDKTVFIRELLQNAIDTVLHRQLYDKYNRIPADPTYEPAVRVTTWTDDERYQWIRVDDDGMGMDDEKIRKYFLKAGESFYTSAEFNDEIGMYGRDGIGNFTPISRFGIGVLSYFLAGDKVEVSTLAHRSGAVRLSMSAEEKYFTTQLEEKGHEADLMPTHPDDKQPIRYRNRCGTSIVVRVAPYQHFENLDFEKVIKKYVMYPTIPIYLNGEPFVTEKEFLDTINEVGILEFPISESVIEEIKREHRVVIQPGASIKVGFLNLSNYVSEQNQESLKGALFLARGCQLSYTDDFYEKNKIKDERAKATLEVGIVNHRVQLILNRHSYFNGIDNLPNKEKKWFSNLYRGISARKVHYDSHKMESESDLNIDLKTRDWYRNHLSYLADDNDYSRLTPRFAHNGISYFHGTSRHSERITFDCLPILLCHNTFRPELSVSREEVQSLPLEMDSEVNLAIRRAFDKHDTEMKFSKDISKFIDESFIDFIPIQNDSFSSITVNEICRLNNFDTKTSWREYYSLHDLTLEQVDKEHILRPCTFPGVIYGTLLQKYNQCKLVKKKDKEYELATDSTAIEDSSIIYDYYPSLFFLPIDNEEELFVRYYSRGFINLNNPEAKQIIAKTKVLYSKYPALFRAFVSAVYDGERYKFEELFQKIKSLPLWKN
jgi:hypothetical protein